MARWRDLLAELLRPSAGESAYVRGVVGLGHAMLGAALVWPFGGYGLPCALAIGAAYWWVKERGDLTRGGALLDGLEDAIMVMLGTFYGAAWWPALMLACAGYLMLMGARRG